MKQIWLPSHVLLQEFSNANGDKKFVIRKVAWMQLFRARLLLINRRVISEMRVSNSLVFFLTVLCLFYISLVVLVLYAYDKTFGTKSLDIKNHDILYALGRSGLQWGLGVVWFTYVCAQAGELRGRPEAEMSAPAATVSIREPPSTYMSYGRLSTEFYRNVIRGIYNENDAPWFFFCRLGADDATTAVKILRATQIFHAAVIILTLTDVAFYAQQMEVPPWLGICLNLAVPFNMTTYRNRILAFVSRSS